MLQKVQVIYSGRVQGVGFRMTVMDLARGLPVVGTVRNVRDGTVELVAIARSSVLMDLMKAIDDRFSRNIEGCLVDWQDGQPGEFLDFSVAPDKF